MRPPDVLIELPLDRGKNRVQGVVIGGFVVLLKRRRCFVRETWRRQGTRYCCPLRPAVVYMLSCSRPVPEARGFGQEKATEGVGVYDCCTLEAGWTIPSYVV